MSDDRERRLNGLLDLPLADFLAAVKGYVATSHKPGELPRIDRDERERIAARLSAIDRAHILAALQGQDRRATQELIEEGRTRRHKNGT